MVIIKCPRCGHEWDTKSELSTVTCSSCQYKVKLKGGKDYVQEED